MRTVEPIGSTVRHMENDGAGNGEERMRVGKWVVPVCIAGGVVVAGCGHSTSPGSVSPRLGVLSGVAGECSGPAETPHPVQVIVYRGTRVVRRQTGLGPHKFTFALPAGRYTVTTNQSAAVPVKVTLSANGSAHASVLSIACD
jgi:hypothetical protein